jgi:lactoylglutathione lyase
VLSTARWTHVALPVADLDASLAWYERYTPLRTIDRRSDEVGQSAWLAHPEATDRPFVLVLVSFDDRRGVRQPQLTPFAHLGVELPTKEEVDAVAERARAEGCLAWEPVQLPPPVGYVCAASDPDGNVVEFSFDQGVAAKVLEVFGEPESARP